MNNNAGLTEIHSIRYHYRSGTDDLSQDFFLPCLKYASHYERASGFFSSSVLLEWVSVLHRFANADELTVFLLIAPELSSQDKQALNQAVIGASRDALRQRIADNFLLDAVEQATTTVGDQRKKFSAELLAWLVANDRLQLKFAFPEHVDSPGIFHEKIGLFHFPWGDRIAFTGSANETGSGYTRNYESIDVYRSWEAAEIARIENKQQQFTEAWKSEAYGLKVLSLSATVLNKVRERAPSNWPIMEENGAAETLDDEYISKWRHQDAAIQKFLTEERGILEMATGTGKTRTALKIIERLQDDDLIDTVVIAADGTDLLNQWAQQILSLPNVVSGDLRVLRHYDEFKERERFEINPKDSFLLSSRYALPTALRNLSSKSAKRTLIIHDEVHRTGSTGKQESLDGLSDNIRFRLGLSATPEREYDEEGTHFIENHIGPVIYEFGLEDAIRRGILAPFNYYPLAYEPTSEDGERIQQVYAKYARKDKEGEPYRQEEVWNDIAKVYKTSRAKLPLFNNFVTDRQELLERCIIFVETREYGEDVFEIVHSYRHDFHTYYAAEDSRVLKDFARGELECLITCHRLSEGIDIQSLNTVILFSSARARLETIQRMGRCLRTDPKNPTKVANVIDFIRGSESGATHLTADEERRDWLTSLSEVRAEE